MTKHIALLRGINVSGHHKIKMNDLIELLTKKGFKNVSTYIQSGNIIFESDEIDKQLIENKISTIIFEAYNYTIKTSVISFEELTNIFNSNPFLNKNAAIDISKLHVTILNLSPTNDLIDQLKSKFIDLDDQFEIYNNIIYIHTPNGYGRTKLTNTVFEKKFSCSSTTRNWKTISKLIELTNTP